MHIGYSAPMKSPTLQLPPASHALHLAELRRRYDEALARHGYDAVVIGAGTELPVHGDDQHYPYRPAPWFVQWVPLTRHPGAVLIYRPGRLPRLVLLEAEDFWHQPAPLPDGDWQQGIALRRARSLAELKRQLPRRHAALLAPPEQVGQLDQPALSANPPGLLSTLAFDRASKTGYEIQQIRTATRLALLGHAAAAARFAAGGSEYEISQAFVLASGQSDADLPYPTIVALNRNAATLHYQHRDPRRPGRGQRHSLLIDAGCSSAGYASDITRTHAARRDRFAGMIRDLDAAQQRLCARLAPGTHFATLQLAAHEEIARLLHDWELVRLPPEAIAEEQITDLFFPHGLGHLLGLQVHDIGGNLLDRAGNTGRGTKRFPRLRLCRELAPGQVLTIEPGIYFIDQLLARLRKHRRARQVNWRALAELHRYGGIRIEDNVLVTSAGSLNLTRAG